MKILLVLVCIWMINWEAKSQEIMLNCGLNMPLKPYANSDILDNTAGSALNGYNVKLDYIIIKQSRLNFSFGMHYFSNPFDVASVQDQNNTLFPQKSKYLSIKPYSGLGLGASILYYFTPLNKKWSGFSKVSLGQLFVSSPEYSKQDSGEYIRILSNDANSIYWSFGAGLVYSISPQFSLIAFAEYYYAKVDFGNIKVRNAFGQTATIVNQKTNEQTINMLNLNLGISYKFYHVTSQLKLKKK